ncbi:MAG: hypothetical protein ACM31L_04265 [Actinomycetota bacterium]
MTTEGALQTLISRVPPEILDTLNEEQRAEIWAACKPVSWRRHPVNVRVTFPFFGLRYFVTIVGGIERRSVERIRREHRVHPIRTAGNVLFLLGVGATFYLAAVLGIFVFSNLIEF